MINIFPKLSKSSAGAPASPGAAARRGAGRGRGVPRPGCGTHEPFWSSQLELAGWTRRAGSPREDRRTASGPVLGLAFASCNVLQFARMIEKKTGKPALAYNGYGCYCGLGGSKQPLDATDWCCHAHDCCYKKLAASGCRPKTVIYKYDIQRKQITCGNGNSCQKRTCACDKRAAECFQRAASSYRKSYSNYPNFKCRGRTPSC